MNEEDTNVELIDLITKKLTGEATIQELDELDRLLSENEADKKTYDLYQKAWDASHMAQGITAGEMRQEWVRLDKAIALQQPKEGFPWFRAAAAFALLIVGLVAVFLVQPFEEHFEVINADNLQETTLPDGSKVILNAGAQIKYSSAFNNDQRELWFYGEGFFDVTSDPSKPFIVHTSAGDVKVVGTSFNVRSDNGTGVAEVIVTSGKVQLLSQDTVVNLVKGDRGVANLNTQIVGKEDNSNPNFDAWRTQSFVFEDTHLSTVVSNLNAVYNSNIYLGANGLKLCPVTVSFKEQSLESILEVLASTFDLKIEKTQKGLRVIGEGCQ